MEEQIQRLQALIFEKEGIDGAHGIACLGKVCQSYGKDPEIMKALVDFVNRSESLAEACYLNLSVMLASFLHTPLHLQRGSDSLKQTADTAFSPATERG